MTRKAGFTSHPDTTGREFKVVAVGGYAIPHGKSLRVIFHVPQLKSGRILGFGAWYAATEGIDVSVTGCPAKYRLTGPEPPNWSCVGSQWYSDGRRYGPVTVTFTAIGRAGKVALWAAGAGGIAHEHLDRPRKGLMGNMHIFAPEANFYVAAEPGSVEIDLDSGVKEITKVAEIVLKACNRCARFLPINIENERHHLSFTNHCTAERARPCKHATFGSLRNIDTGQILKLDCGFQLECRICKKFEVNAAHNPQRSAAQMKEDAARRRSFELLLTELYGRNPSLRYREETGGRELTDDVYAAFGGRCFKCDTHLATPNDMHLDHTRPLALLWPLDGTATSLCETCNSSKRDRPPVAFYSQDELARLSKITGIPLKEIESPDPNTEAIGLLRDRLDWFFDKFLVQPELLEERDGKIAADLLLKALQKAIDAAPRESRFNLLAMSDERRGEMPEDVGDETELL
jgi:hypothetical protein